MEKEVLGVNAVEEAQPLVGRALLRTSHDSFLVPAARAVAQLLPGARRPVRLGLPSRSGVEAGTGYEPPHTPRAHMCAESADGAPHGKHRRLLTTAPAHTQGARVRARMEGAGGALHFLVC